MYKKIEGINDKYENLEVPAVVFYTNIKPTKCTVCGDRDLEGAGNVYECTNCKSKIEIMGASEWKITITDEDRKDTFNKGDRRKKLDTCEIMCGEVNKSGETTCEVETMKEMWSDIFVYGKMFISKKGAKNSQYFKFRDLALAGEDDLGIPREKFPEMPRELDVKNLFYVWVGNFVIKNEKNNGNKSKNEWVRDIKKKIGEVWTGKTSEEEEKIHAFEKRFGDLDVVYQEGDAI
jgi:hypothetical protein